MSILNTIGAAFSLPSSGSSLLAGLPVQISFTDATGERHNMTAFIFIVRPPTHCGFVLDNENLESAEGKIEFTRRELSLCSLSVAARSVVRANVTLKCDQWHCRDRNHACMRQK
jgi:hypothetical protein